MNKNIYTVSEINFYLKKIIEKEQNLINISLQGEISNIVNHSSGHIYFTIKDNKSQIKAIIFYYNSKNLQFKLKEGLKIIATGSIKIYEPRGTYNLQIIDLSLDGIGNLFLKYEKLKYELNKKGWFEKSIKKTISIFPNNIGIITAPTGAAIKDIIITIHRRFPIANIYLFPSIVQGEEAKNDICTKIKIEQNFIPKIDTLIIGRGGGNIEDLWAFNEIEVVEEIYKSKIPIISAIGHEIDFTLSDFVSDLRAPTPTSAAELATPNQKELNFFLQQQHNSLINIIKIKIDKLENNLKKIKNSYTLTKPKLLYTTQQHYYQSIFNKFNILQETFFLTNKNIIKYYYQIIVKEIKQKISEISYYKNNLLNKLDLLSPLKTIIRGYSVTYDKYKNILSSIKYIKNNDIIITHVQDGNIESVVKKLIRMVKKWQIINHLNKF